jgi:hypothetical protein
VDVTGVQIEVSVDELTVRGLDPGQGSAFVSALRAELAGALAGWRPGATAGSGLDVLDLGTVPVAPGAAPARAGRAVAAQIADALRSGNIADGRVAR